MTEELRLGLGERIVHNGLSFPSRSVRYRVFFNLLFRRRVVLFGAAIILVFVLTAVFAEWLAPYNPYELTFGQALQDPTWQHLLGTDELGRDLLSRIIYGSRISLFIGLIAVGIAALIGMCLGLLAGYFGGWADTIIMRLIDALMSIPQIVLALAITAVLGGGLRNVMIAIGISTVPTYCRLMRGQVLTIKQSEFVTAATVVGAGNLRIMLFHIAPNCLPPLIVLITLNMGMAILIEAGLSYLGMGVRVPEAAWGSMISSGYLYLLTNPLVSFAPGVCIMLAVLSFNLLGDGLRDALDPRLKGTN